MFDITGHFNDKIHDALSKTQYAPYEFYNYIEKDGLEEQEKYNFEGWIKETDWQEKKTTSLSDISITGDLKLIAKYEVRSVYDPDYTTNINCFKVENGAISVNSSYKSVLKGKITLPLQYSGVDIHTIGDFKNTAISYIYFAEGNSKYTTVSSGAFTLNTDIINIDLPSSITTIGSQAFQDCSSLNGIGNVQSIEKIHTAAFERCYSLHLNLDEMPRLSEIGVSAFAMTSPPAEGISGETFSLITDLPAFAFQYCPNINVSNLTKISKTTNATATMPSLRDCGQNTTLIQIDANNIKTCSEGAFTGYAKNANVLEVYNATGLNEETLLAILEYVGLNRNWTNKHIYDFGFGEE